MALPHFMCECCVSFIKTFAIQSKFEIRHSKLSLLHATLFIMCSNLDISNTTRLHPRVPFEKIKNTILGRSYELSLVLMGDTMATRLNAEHKNKKGPTNVLSFPLTKNEGEIFINVRRAQRDAKKFDHSPLQHLAFLFIHGCLHLKGYTTHSNKMEQEEERLLRKLYK